MKSIQLFTVIIILVVITSFGLDKVNFRDYFWNISNYETPMVLIYTNNNNGIKSTIYYLIQKTGENELTLIRYNKDFNEVQYFKDLFKPEGVYLKETSFVEGNNPKLITKSVIHNGLIFPFQNYKCNINMEVAIDLQSKKNINITNKDNWKFTEIADKKINNITISTIVAKGYTNQIITDKTTGKKQSYKVMLETWYSKGIGITLMKRETPNGPFIDTYVKSISLQEFNKLRGEK
jgi:hypothetical protein